MLAASQIRHSTRAGMFTSRGQKADRPVNPNGYSFVLKIQDGKRVVLLGINLVLGTAFFVDLECWYALLFRYKYTLWTNGNLSPYRVRIDSTNK